MLKLKQYRNFGYDLIINNFEPLFRRFIEQEIFQKYFPDDWKSHIPKHVVAFINEFRNLHFEDYDFSADLLEEIGIYQLQDILLKPENFIAVEEHFSHLSKTKIKKLMKDLNQKRIKVAHAKSSYSKLDFHESKKIIQYLCNSDYFKNLNYYIDNKLYQNAKDVSLKALDEFDCQNNLPQEDYDIEGGFVGRKKEISDLMSLINSEQDRIITITGAGGAGKTAIALKIAYNYLETEEQRFEAIIWFSAKTSRLTAEGINPLEPQFSNLEQLLEDIFALIDPNTFEIFLRDKIPIDYWKNHINNIFSSYKCLIIIDNLETVYSEEEIVNFLKEIPRPSTLLITSRKGLGEIERNYAIRDLPDQDALQLFNLVCEARNRDDLLNLNENAKINLINRVQNYPLLIKWAIGQVCLGKDVNSAFNEDIKGNSDIAQFSFNDVYYLLSESSKKILFSMIIYGKKSITKPLIQHLTNLNDEEFNDAIKDLMISSLIFAQTSQNGTNIITKYNALSLTRNFIESKLDENKKMRINLLSRYHDLSETIKEFEKSISDYTQTYFKLGVKTPEEKIAVNHVKTAKNAIEANNIERAETNFAKALKIAPELAYVLTEYSKFEFYEKNRPNKALELAKQATIVEPDNYHGWWYYGLLLKRVKKYDEAIQNLIKAKKLNFDYLPIYNVLGEVYTRLGFYEKAEKEFQNALEREKYPNYRHKKILYQDRANNFLDWAKSYEKKHDSKNALICYSNAYESILNALEINESEAKLISLYREICFEYGKELGYQKDPKNLGFLKKAIKTFQFDTIFNNPSNKMLIQAIYHIISFNSNVLKSTEIQEYLSICDKRVNKFPKWKRKLKILIEERKLKTENTEISQKKHEIAKIISNLLKNEKRANKSEISLSNLKESLCKEMNLPNSSDFYKLMNYSTFKQFIIELKEEYPDLSYEVMQNKIRLK